jgi:hypothetical protein
VKGAKTQNWGTLRLTRDPALDTDYRYTLVVSGNSVRIAAIPRRAGLGGWLAIGGFFAHIYYNPRGPASETDKKIGGYSTGVVFTKG